MKYFVDTEYIEDGRTIDLLSIGIVAEDGREFYVQHRGVILERASDWVRTNVLPHLQDFSVDAVPGSVVGGRNCKCWDRTDDSGFPDLSDSWMQCVWQPQSEIANRLIDFCNPDKHGKPEFWGYYADYDWVAMCQLFGRMIDLPKGWPMYMMDIKQWAVLLGNPTLPKQLSTEHHALADARWNLDAWTFLASKTSRYE